MHNYIKAEKIAIAIRTYIYPPNLQSYFAGFRQQYTHNYIKAGKIAIAITDQHEGIFTITRKNTCPFAISSLLTVHGICIPFTERQFRISIKFAQMSPWATVSLRMSSSH